MDIGGRGRHMRKTALTVWPGPYNTKIALTVWEGLENMQNQSCHDWFCMFSSDCHTGGASNLSMNTAIVENLENWCPGQGAINKITNINRWLWLAHVLNSLDRVTGAWKHAKLTVNMWLGSKTGVNDLDLWLDLENLQTRLWQCEPGMKTEKSMIDPLNY